MSENSVEITCSRCGHTWIQDLTALDEKDVVIYKGQAQPERYRVPCPRCGTKLIVTVAEEEGHG